MDIYEEAKARTKGVSPASRRLQLGLSAIVSRPDGAVVELFPGGWEVVLDPPRESGPDHDADVNDGNGECKDAKARAGMDVQPEQFGSSTTAPCMSLRN